MRRNESFGRAVGLLSCIFFLYIGLTLTRRPKNVLTLTKVLAESLGAGYVEVALETYVSSLPAGTVFNKRILDF